MLNTLKRIAKDLLAITWIRRVYEFVNRLVLEIFGSSRILTHLWYFVSFITFNREQAAVLRGRRDYYRNKHRDRVTHVELRRNVHRLEKGLIMRPRRDVFARDYITETIEFYEEGGCAVPHRPRHDGAKRDGVGERRARRVLPRRGRRRRDDRHWPARDSRPPPTTR